MDALCTITDPARAELVMHPLRRGILEAAAGGPVSATEVARRLGESRQKLNYHLRALLDAGLLEPAGERPRRGLTEKLYRASARAYTVSPEVLGSLAPSPDDFRDAYSAGTLVALAERMHAEVTQSARQAQEAGKRLATLSLDTEVRFTSAEQQSRFAEALLQAVADVVSRFAEPGTGTRGHAYRLVAGAYPVPADRAAPPGSSEPESSGPGAPKPRASDAESPGTGPSGPRSDPSTSSTPPHGQEP